MEARQVDSDVTAVLTIVTVFLDILTDEMQCRNSVAGWRVEPRWPPVAAGPWPDT